MVGLHVQLPSGMVQSKLATVKLALGVTQVTPMKFFKAVHILQLGALDDTAPLVQMSLPLVSLGSLRPVHPPLLHPTQLVLFQ